VNLMATFNLPSGTLMGDVDAESLWEQQERLERREQELEARRRDDAMFNHQQTDNENES